jgi:hypothetical protein
MAFVDLTKQLILLALPRAARTLDPYLQAGDMGNYSI